MADLYDALIQNAIKQLDTSFQQKSQELSKSIGYRGDASPELYSFMQKQLNESYMNELSNIVPQLELQRIKMQKEDERFGQQSELERFRATTGASQGERAMQEQRAGRLSQEAIQKRNQDLQEQQLIAQKEAIEQQQNDWYKPLLGQIAGGLLGTLGGGLIAGLLPMSQFQKALLGTDKIGNQTLIPQVGNMVLQQLLSGQLQQPNTYQSLYNQPQYKLENTNIGGYGGYSSSPNYNLNIGGIY